MNSSRNNPPAPGQPSADAGSTGPTPSGRTRILLPDLLYHEGRFVPGWGVAVDETGGRIIRVGPEAEVTASAGAAAGVVVERLPGRALLPGFVNAHSHAFQRLIRGRTQWRPASAPQADFWSWREAMYAAALALTPEDVYDVSRACFLEMLHAGYTTVGEFHYLQRDPDGQRYADPNELAHRVIAAAESVGIRISLLNVCYATGGIDQPLHPEQRRFKTPDAERFLADTGALRRAWADHSGVTVGIAPHSVRAVPRAWLPELHAWATYHDLPFHIHASEQPAEVEAAVAAWGLRPIELLAEEGVLDERLTAVHATHLTPGEVALLGDAGATVCACPTTERDLGDGFLPGSELLAAGARIALGSDSQTVIDPLEEMRLVEYHERLQRLRRVVIAVPGEADRLENAAPLLEMGTESGARALRLEAGRIAAGQLADLAAIDLEHPTLAGFTPEYLAATLTLSAPAAVVSDLWVGGVRRVEGRRHQLDEEAPAALRALARRIT
jgi:formimidoylglutamate deiminase